MAEGEGLIGGQADGGHFIIVVYLGEEDGTVCVCLCVRSECVDVCVSVEAVRMCDFNYSFFFFPKTVSVDTI